MDVEHEGNLTIYRVAYRQSKLKFLASAWCTLKAAMQAKRAMGSIDRIFLNVFYPLGAHIPWISKWLKAPVYAIEHWTGYHQTNPSFNEKHLHLKMALLMSSYCKRVFGVSEDLNESMRSYGLKNVEGVVYNVVDEEIFNNIGHVQSNSFKWLHISTLKDEHKNFSLLLRSFAVASQASSATLTVINSENFESYIPLIKDLNIKDKVKFTGKLELTEVARIMKRSDAFVLSSNFENMPCVIAEALCCGLPVVSTNVGGIREVIHETNGKLVPKGDAVALTQAMQEMETNRHLFNPETISLDAIDLFGSDAILTQMKKALDL